MTDKSDHIPGGYLEMPDAEIRRRAAAAEGVICSALDYIIAMLEHEGHRVRHLPVDPGQRAILQAIKAILEMR